MEETQIPSLTFVLKGITGFHKWPLLYRRTCSVFTYILRNMCLYYRLYMGEVSENVASFKYDTFLVWKIVTRELSYAIVFAW